MVDTLARGSNYAAPGEAGAQLRDMTSAVGSTMQNSMALAVDKLLKGEGSGAASPLAGYCSIEEIDELNTRLSSVLRSMDQNELPFKSWDVVQTATQSSSVAIDVDAPSQDAALVQKTANQLQSFHRHMDIAIPAKDLEDLDPVARAEILADQARELTGFMIAHESQLIRILGAMPASNALPIKNNLHNLAFSHIIASATAVVAAYEKKVAEAELPGADALAQMSAEEKLLHLKTTLTWVYSLLLLDRVEQLRAQALLRAVYGKAAAEEIVDILSSFSDIE